ncbi:MAG TPA: hypothetical protein VFC21_07580, partial [Bryobacteraceae bacterium]|nr:hypothetical protein [Bryobacteraceae bacterium]
MKKILTVSLTPIAIALACGVALSSFSLLLRVSAWSQASMATSVKRPPKPFVPPPPQHVPDMPAAPVGVPPALPSLPEFGGLPPR